LVKKITIVAIIFSVVGLALYFLQSHFMGPANTLLQTLLRESYLFHGVFSLVVIILFFLLSTQKKFFPQLGFIYIGLLVFKIMVFTIIFQPYLLGDQLLSLAHRAYLLVPIFIFLMLEVIFLSKLLYKKQP
jgi:DMSO/TMAO reductase YedYZ heme-binding membrane subunit